MKILRTAIVIGLLAAPALAQSGIDLPRLTWPDETTTSQGCTNPIQPGAPTGCPKS